MFRSLDPTHHRPDTITNQVDDGALSQNLFDFEPAHSAHSTQTYAANGPASLLPYRSQAVTEARSPETTEASSQAATSSQAELMAVSSIKVHTPINPACTTRYIP